MTVVVDANILIAFGLSDEPMHAKAMAKLSDWRSEGVPLAAPRLFRSEITAVIRKVVYQGRVTHDQGQRMLMQLLAYPVRLHEDTALLMNAYELAHRFDRPRAYDSQYLALANQLSCNFSRSNGIGGILFLPSSPGPFSPALRWEKGRKLLLKSLS